MGKDETKRSGGDPAPRCSKLGCGRGGCWFKLCWSCRLAEIWEQSEDGEEGDDCCSCGSANEAYPLDKDAKWHKGKCTDVFCIILFALFWVGMLAVCVLGFTLGNTSRILYANDFNGQNCHTGGTGLGKCTRPGRSCPEDLYGKKMIVYPRLKDDLLFAIASGFDSNKPEDGVNLLKLRLYGVCREECPSRGDYVCNYEYDVKLNAQFANQTARADHVNRCYSTLWAIPSFISAYMPSTGMLGDCVDIIKNCWITPIDTVNVFNRCLPALEAIESVHDDCILPTLAGDGIAANSMRCITIKRAVDVQSERPAGDQIIYDKLDGAASYMMKVRLFTVRFWANPANDLTCPPLKL